MGSMDTSCGWSLFRPYPNIALSVQAGHCSDCIPTASVPPPSLSRLVTVAAGAAAGKFLKYEEGAPTVRVGRGAVRRVRNGGGAKLLMLEGRRAAALLQKALLLGLLLLFAFTWAHFGRHPQPLYDASASPPPSLPLPPGCGSDSLWY